ncbi:DUF4870 domain-containing protein [Tenuibacillus multivorans]|uniref:Uncharacterized membrane protein n=1 Tax=Tenuibacillus multivorans TaxID=237069 RepID=A0A1G9WB86_9BACI|nr:hypothetical protein [Tenuibacillus multivorans]SDM81729.1 Uncharacterized membrane protein [Tenuibacillus multivorans]
MSDEQEKGQKEARSQVDKEEATSDAEENKGLGVVAYIIFFLPLLVAKESKFAMYHANQGLMLLITAVIINVVGTIIPIIGWILILPLGNLFIFILWLIGIINAAKGEMKPLPLIGKYEILK